MKPKQTFTFNELTAFFGLPDFETLRDRWIDEHVAEQWVAIENELLSDYDNCITGDIEPEYESRYLCMNAAQEKADKYREKVYKKYVEAIEHAINLTLEHLDLEVSELKNGSYKITPMSSWDKSLKLMVNTINSIGDYGWSDCNKDFKAAMCITTDRCAVLEFMRVAAKNYSAVYGTRTMESTFNDHFTV